MEVGRGGGVGRVAGERGGGGGEVDREGGAVSVNVRSGLRSGCCWLIGCLTSQQHASVSQARIC